MGKILSCPRCARNFTTRVDGRLVQVVKGRNGQWIDQGLKLERERETRSQWLKLGGGVAALVLLFIGVFWGPNIIPDSKAGEHTLPVELESRAQLFGRAWLTGDYPLMRRLTDPAQDRSLYAWYRRNPPPPMTKTDGTAAAVRTNIEVIPDVAPFTRVQVSFDGLQLADGSPPLEQQLLWEERGGMWIFQPNPVAVPKVAR